MKNLVYVGVIAACILLAVVVFVKTRSGDGSGIESLSDTEMVWVKCGKCNQSYEMGMKQYYQELEEKAKANPTPIPVAHPLTCQKCNADAVRKAVKCEGCGDVFYEGSVPNDFADRCPKCKFSKTEAIRKERQAQRGG